MRGLCHKTDTKEFLKLQKELNVSEGDLVAAIDSTGSDLQPDNAAQRGLIYDYFNIGTEYSYKSKKEADKAQEAVKKITSSYSTLSPAQTKRAKIQLDKLGIPYTVYTDSNGKQAIRMATPVYKNEDDEIVLNPGAFSTNPGKITQSTIKDITKHFGNVVGIRASNSDESGDVIITFSKGLEVPVSLQSGMMDWSLDSNVKLAEKLGLVKKEKGKILVQSSKTHNVFFALSNLAYNWLQSMPRHANLLRDTIKQSELTALNKELRGESYDASKDTTLATRMFIPRGLMREREVSSGKAKLTNYRYNTETTTPELDFVTDKGNNITIWWDTSRNEFECRITKKGKKNPESNLDVFDSKEQKQKYLKEFLTDSYIKFFESGEAEKLNNEDARTSYTTKLNDALNSRFGIIYKQLTSDDYVPAKKTKAAKTDDNEEVKEWAVKSDKGFEVSTKAAKDSSVVGDARFSAFNAKFAKGTKVLGQDVSGKSVEWVYQNVIKRGKKGGAPAKDSILNYDIFIQYFEEAHEGDTSAMIAFFDDYPFMHLASELVRKLHASANTGNKGLAKLEEKDLQNVSYYMGYLPLWTMWAEQNPKLIEELRKESKGKVLTDSFAGKTVVNQARALSDILNGVHKQVLDDFGQENKKPAELKKEDKTKKKANKKTPLEIADEIVAKIKQDSEDRISFDAATHTYFVDGEEANLSVTQYLELTQEKTGTKEEEESKKAWFRPAGRLGTTVDKVTRDFFSGNLKESYPNLTNEQLNALKEDLEYLKTMLEEKFEGTLGKDFKVVTDEFPISARYSVGNNGETRVMAGTMDMLVYDKKGNFYIFDMKAKRSSLAENRHDKQKYMQQLNMYRAILEANYPELKGRIKELNIIEFRVGYPAPVGAINSNGDAIGEIIYEEQGDLQVLSDGKLIQNTKGYRAPRLVRDFIPLGIDNDYDKMFSALSPEDAELLAEETGSKKVKAEDGNNTDNDDIAVSRLYGNTILNATERSFLANYVMNLTSYIITHLQTNPKAKETYFPDDDSLDKKDFTKMTREEVIKEVGLGRIFNYIKENYFNSELSSSMDPNIWAKLDVAYDNFSALVRSGYAKLIMLEGISVVNNRPKAVKMSDIEESLDDEYDSTSIEEKEHEHWQIGIRQISARSSLSGDIRRAFEKLLAVDKNKHPIKDKYGYNFDTFVDSSMAVNSILEWCNNCTTLEEMIKIIESKEDANPWVRSILNLIEKEPFRSQFFQNFRKDFTTYSIVRPEYDDNGNRYYVTEIINTRGAHAAIMSDIVNSFKLGKMRNLIIPIKGDINGAGRVNVAKVEELQAERARIRKELSTAFKNDNTESRTKAKEAFSRNLVDIQSLLTAVGMPMGIDTIREIFKDDPTYSEFDNTNLSKIFYNIDNLLNTLLENKEDTTYEPIKRNTDGNVYSHYKNIANIVSRFVQDNIEASTYENGKMHYSFTVPSYMGKLITNLSNAINNKSKFNKFLKEEYLSYKWFKDGDTYNNEWIRLIEKSPKIQRNFQHKVQLSFDGTAYTDLSELGYTLSLMQEYFFDTNKEWAWYRLPILANKPSSEFVKFKRYSRSRYKKDMTPLFRKVFNQELMRIKTVLERTNASDIQRIGSKGKLTFDIDNTKVSDDFKKRVKNGNLRIQDLVKDDKLIFGKSGASFKFLPAFNEAFIEYAKADRGAKHDEEKAELGKLLLDKLNGKNTNESRVGDLFGKIFNDYMDLVTKQELSNWETLGLFDVETKTRKIHGKNVDVTRYKYLSQFLRNGDYNLEDEKTAKEARATIEQQLEEYVWNDMFATINIIELTATDLAYYKNIEDFQKRYSQVHAPSMRLNTTAKMDNGNPYADKYERTMYLADNIVKSELIPNVATIFDKKIADLRGVDAEHMSMMKDIILHAFEEINVADAQGFSSPTSFRKKLAMQGKWNKTMEDAYNRIKSGDFNINDLEVVWQPEKPFVYSQIRKNSGVETMAELKVGVQNKNSEYLLILADALMRSGNEANRLTAIYDFMEDTAYTGRISKNGKVTKEGSYNARGIDTIQFVSAVNAGSMGVIDINNTVLDEAISDISNAESIIETAIENFENSNNEAREYKLLNSVLKKIKGKSSSKVKSILKENITEEIKAKLHDAAFKYEDEHIATNAKGKMEIDPYNDQFVHNIPWEDYGIQQEVPQHLQDHQQLMGSQMRILSISDITPGTKFQVYTRNGTKHMDSEQLIQEYQEAIAENIRDSFKQLERDLKLNGSRKEKNKKIAAILQESIQNDSRYGEDLLRACTLNSEGEFTIPLSDPIQSIRIQQLLNSIIKSRINKQKVKGGPVVQATSFGLSDELHIRFKDDKGNILKTFTEYGKSEEEYKKYLNKNQASIAYFECYMPIPSKDLERKLIKPDGSMMTIDEAEEAGIIPKEMRKAIGYRIPTEDKYSMAPLYIKGFLPKAAGEAIMLPKEITLLSGSDFDIDKMYIMLKSFSEDKKIDTSNLRKVFREATKDWQAKKKLSTKKEGYNNAKEIRDAAINLAIKAITNPDIGGLSYLEGGDDISEAAVRLYKWYQKNSSRYETKYFKEGKLSKRDYNNNKIFDMQWAVLTNADTMDKMFNPGSFDVQKITARKVNLIKAGYSLEELDGKTLDELDDMMESSSNLNIGLSSTQVYFHKQNMTAGKLIGIFANNNTSHAFLSMQDISLRFEEGGFTFDGVKVTNNSNNRLDLQRGKNGALISKTIAGFLAASVDAVKDPVLNYMNLNTMTAGPAMLLARLGFDSDSIGLLLTQPIIEQITREYFKRNNEGYTSVDDVISETLQLIKEEAGIDYNTIKKDVINTEFTKEELAEGLAKKSDIEFQTRVLLLFQQLATISQDLQTITFITKFNSVTNAVGPTISDTFVMRERINKFIDKMNSEHAPFNSNAHPDNIFKNSAILSAFYDTTIKSGGASDKIFRDYFPHYSDKFKEILDEMRTTTKGKLDAKTINKLVNEFVLYKLTLGKHPILSANSEVRNAYINEFINTFANGAEGLIDNDLIKIITTTPATEKCPVETLEAKTGGYSADVQERVKNAWSTLIQNPKTRKLGVDLFIYNMFRSGFSFSPKSFMHLATTDVKLAIDGYVETIRDVSFEDDNVNTQAFLLMFRRNHTKDSKIVPKLIKTKAFTVTEGKSLKGNTITIKFDKFKNGVKGIITEESEDGDTFAPVITYEDKVYMSPKVVGRSVVYIETTPLGNTNNFLEYDANDNAVSMQSVIGKSNKDSKEAEESKKPEEKEVDNSKEHQEKDEDPDKSKKSKKLSDRELKEHVLTTVFTKAGKAEIGSHVTEETTRAEVVDIATDLAMREGKFEKSDEVREKIRKIIDKLCK